MATAAKSISVGPIGVDAGPIPLPGIAEMFAAMVTGTSGEETQGDSASLEPKAEIEAESPETVIDASVLLPLLDQQRAATPAAKLVGAPVDTPSPERVKISGAKAGGEGPTPAAPSTADAMIAPAQPEPVAVTLSTPAATPNVAPGPVTAPAPIKVADPAPVMRPLETGDPVPVMRPLGKAATTAATDPAPVMRPLQDAKPAPDVASNPAPVMRPIKGEVSKAGPEITMPASEPDRPAVTAAPTPVQTNVQPTPSIEAKLAATIAVPPTEVQPVPAAPQPKPVAKIADAKVPAQEMPVTVTAAQAEPIAAKPRAMRAPAASQPIAVEFGGTDTTSVTATATETRAAVQPVPAAPSLVQPAAAPVAPPVQNVAAALSQQVLDMSGGDAWIDQIARDISQTAGKDGTMRFRLAPETLGELKVEISHSERGAHVRLNVSSETAQQALAAAEHKLTAEARAQGVRIAETEINFTGGQSQSRDASAFGREQAQQQAQASHQPRTPRGASANTFTSSAAAPEGRGRTDRYA